MIVGGGGGGGGDCRNGVNIVSVFAKCFELMSI